MSFIVELISLGSIIGFPVLKLLKLNKKFPSIENKEWKYSIEIKITINSQSGGKLNRHSFPHL